MKVSGDSFSSRFVSLYLLSSTVLIFNCNHCISFTSLSSESSHKSAILNRFTPLSFIVLRNALFLFLYVILSLGSDKFKPFFNLSGYLFSFLMRYSKFSLKYSLEFSFAAKYKGNSSLLVLYEIIILISDSHSGFSLLFKHYNWPFFCFSFLWNFHFKLVAVPLLVHCTKGE